MHGSRRRNATAAQPGSGGVAYTSPGDDGLNLAQLLVARGARPSGSTGAAARRRGRSGATASSPIASRALAGHLRALGLAPGDRVALLMKNHPPTSRRCTRAWWAGLAAVPVNAKLHPRKSPTSSSIRERAALFVSDDLAASVAPLLEPAARDARRPDTPAYEAALAARRRSPPRRARPTTSPGSSTPRGRPADPRA